MKRCRLFNALVLAASLLFTTISCEIGLGASVDIAAPTVAITYPAQSSVIRDTFVLAGDCDDDKGVSKVHIAIYRTDTGKSQLIKEFDVPANNVTGSWQTEVNAWLGDTSKGYNGWELCDGKYIANASSIDNTGRASGTASLSFDIDNTAPIFILKNPTSEKTSSPSQYGTTFKVNGTLSDDHTVSTMIVKIYDKDSDPSDPEAVPLAVAEESNIDTTAEVVIANYSKKPGEVLKETYTKMYAGVDEGTDKTLKCTISVQDNAKLYKDPKETENTTTGNTTGNFYITDNVNSVWTSADMDPGRVKKVVNRTASNVTEELSAQVLDLYNNKASTFAAFSINSDSNPTYEIGGYDVAKDQSIGKFATTSATLSVSLNYGRNQENIKPETLKLFLWGPFEINEVTDDMRSKMYSTDFENVLEPYYLAQKAAGKAQVMAANCAGGYEGVKYINKENQEIDAGYVEGSKDYHIQSVSITADIDAGKCYYISAYAEDLMGAAATPKSYFYAFKGQKTGAAPEIHWSDIDTLDSEKRGSHSGINSVDEQGICNGDPLEFYGYVYYSDGIESAGDIKYRVIRSDVLNSSNTLPEYTGKVTTVYSDKKNIYWKFTVPGITAGSEVVQNYRMTVTADSETVNVEAKRNCQVDTQKPKVSLTSLTPTLKVTTKDAALNDVTKECINGTITVEGSVEDKNTDTIWYEIFVDDAATPVYSTKDTTTYNSESRSISDIIDTTDPKYGFSADSVNNVKIVYHAVDKAGNEGTAETKSYVLDQNTDIPSITTTNITDPAGTTKANLSSGAWYDKNGKLSFVISDDDGLAENGVVVYVNGTANTQTVSKGSTNLSLSYPVPVTEGVYQIKVTATDKTYADAADAFKKYRTYEWATRTIGIDNALPEVTDAYSKGTNTYNKTSMNKFKGTATDTNGIKEIEVKVVNEKDGVEVKKYTLSATEAANKVTYTSNKDWSVSIADGSIEDGTYKVTTTATDYAGKSKTASSKWVFDKTPPSITSSKITTTKSSATGLPSGEDWYKSELISVEVVASDGTGGSGIADVQYRLNNAGGWSSLRQDKDDETKWTYSIACAQGKNTIELKTIDKVNLESTVVTKTVYVDTEGPAFVSYTKDGSGVALASPILAKLNDEFVNDKQIKAADSVKVTVNVSDPNTKNTGIGSVAVTKIGKTTVNIPGTLSSGSYNITIPASNFAAIDNEYVDVVVTATDKIGNSTSETVATLFVDTTAPKITIYAPTPVVEKNSKKNLNGTVSITGTIDESNLSEVWYEVYSGTSTTPVDTVNIASPGAILNIDYDTTKKATDKANINVKIYAKDKAGNQVSTDLTTYNKGTSYYLDQSTDVPEVTLSNVSRIVNKTSTVTAIAANVGKGGTDAEAEAAWFTGTTNSIIGTVSDDDILKSVKISGGSAAKEFIDSSSTASTINFSYPLPAADGVYSITIAVQDKTYGVNSVTANRSNTVGPFIVGVDTAAPTITETHSATTTYSKDNISLSGTASDTNGIKEISVNIINTKDSSQKASYIYKASNADSANTVKLTGTTWTCAVNGLAEGNYKAVATAKDYSGKTKAVETKFVIDNTAPSIGTITLPTATEGWYGTNTVKVSAVVTDATSDVAGVYYTTKASPSASDWSPFSREGQTTTWSANVNCPNQGSNTITIKAVDAAAAVLGETNHSVTKTQAIKIDSAEPAVCTLVSVDSEAGVSKKLINGTAAVSFIITAKDPETSGNGIGLKTVANGGVKVTAIGTTDVSTKTTITVTAGSNDQYTITIPAALLKSGATVTSGNVYVTLTDKFNRSKKFSVFALDVDAEAPKSSFTELKDADTDTADIIDVNGSITVSGSSSDNVELSSVTLYYKAESTKRTTAPSSWTGWTKVDVAAADFYAWNTTINTTSLTDNYYLSLYAVAKDSAGNTSVTPYSTTKAIKINQATDIPKATLMNLALSKKDGDYYWHTSKTLLGTVVDDDGDITSVQYRTKATSTASWSSWSDNIYENSQWKITFSNEGINIIDLKITDSVGTVFILSKDSGSKAPVIYDQDDTVYTATSLPLKIDTTAPVIQKLKGYVRANSTYTYNASDFVDLSSMPVIGGVNGKFLYVQATIKEANDIGSYQMNFANWTIEKGKTAPTNTAIIKDEFSNGTYTLVVRFDISKLTAVSKLDKYKVKVNATDKADKQAKQVEETVSVDNMSPEVSFSKASDTLYGSIENTIYGRTTDGSEITNLYYAITYDSTVLTTSSDKWKEVKYGDNDEITRDNWSLYFDGGTTVKDQFHLDLLRSIYKADNSKTDAWMDAREDNLSMNLWAYAKDEHGNVSNVAKMELTVVPNADIPTIEIIYPKGDQPVGGTIRINGSTEIKQRNVSKVYVQIDPDSNGTSFASNWDSKLATLGCTYTIESNISTKSGYEKGIPATGTTGWSLVINADKKFDSKVSGANRIIGIRAFAVSDTGKVSNLPVVYTEVDSDAPRFEDRLLVQLDGSGNVIASQEYKEGAAISGQWYLRVKICDDSGIIAADVTGDNITDGNLIEDGVVKKSAWVKQIADSGHTYKNEKGVDVTYYDYILTIPVGSTETGKFGKLTYKVNITDGTEGGGTPADDEYSVTYDNKAPELEVTTDVSTITNTNGTFAVKGTVKEAGNEETSQTGFERVVMYVTKTAGGKTYVVDPMISAGDTSGIDNRFEVTSSQLNTADNLYWITSTVAKVTNGEMTVSASSINGKTIDKPAIRTGGLCKVDGVIYRVKKVEGSKVTLDDSTTNSSATTVYFAAGAMVIDHKNSAEGRNEVTAVYDPSATDVIYGDDGDQMIEKVNTVDTTTDWSASIDSTQILDGSVNLVFVAFDGAGNTSKVTKAGVVENNTLRLVGVKFGSDLNNDGEVTWNNDYKAVNYVQGTTPETSITVNAADRQIVKSNLHVIPQLIGGNLGLEWQVGYTDESGAAKKAAVSGTTVTQNAFAEITGAGHSHDVIRNYGTDKDAADYETANDSTYEIELNTVALLKMNVGRSTTAKKNQNFTFKIQDKNEDHVKDVSITLPVSILLTDGNKPTVKYTPFYWNSSSENSLYNNSKEYGHIELPADWANSSKKGDYKDTDNGTFVATYPKVSGMVTIEGEVRDDVLVDQIIVNLDGTTDITIASRNTSGTGWTSTNLMVIDEDNTYESYVTGDNKKDWYFELVEDTTDPDTKDNVVKFKFHWDTRKLHSTSAQTKKAVAFKLSAKDKGTVSLGTGDVLTYSRNTSAISTYTMDVVPYIAHVYTSLASLKKANVNNWSVVNRTALGKYPVRVSVQNQAGTAINEGETISFYGFNLDGAKYGSNSLTTPGADSKLPSPEGLFDIRNLNANLISTSANVDLIVNKIKTINNYNNNDADGEYNRIPNTSNNANLTDDLDFDVWTMKEGAARSAGRLEQPFMKVDPSTGKLGFAFVDGTFSFAMGGNNGTNNYSYTNKWAVSTDFCTSTGFTYDSLGRSWGVTAGGESGSDYSDYLVLMSSIWGNGVTTYEGTLNKMLRIERIAQGTHLNIDKQRIQSTSMTSVVHNSNSTHLFLAYYDAINSEIRIKYGDFGAANIKNNVVQNEEDFSMLTTSGKNNSKNISYDDCRKLVSIIANKTGTSVTEDGSTTYKGKAGQYVSIAAIPNGDNDTVVAVWYDGKTMWYSRNLTANAASDYDTSHNRGTWSTPIEVFTGSMERAGEYCKVVADYNGGIHIAAYDPRNKDLCYAYLDATTVNGTATTSSFRTCVVDSQGVTGSNINIDVGITSSKLVPHISYYSESILKAKEAYYVGGFAADASTVGAGADAGMFTGNWEVSAIPTRYTVEMQSNQHNDICIGLWKTAAGVIKNSQTGTAAGDGSYGTVWGNGTAYPAVGYVSQINSSKSCMEVAQKR